MSLALNDKKKKFNDTDMQQCFDLTGRRSLKRKDSPRVLIEEINPHTPSIFVLMVLIRKHRFYKKICISGILECITGTHIAIVSPTLHEECCLTRKGYHFFLNILKTQRVWYINSLIEINASGLGLNKTYLTNFLFLFLSVSFQAK